MYSFILLFSVDASKLTANDWQPITAIATDAIARSLGEFTG